MKESYVEGVAAHDGPESCADAREGSGEALTGETAGWVLSREILKVQGADAVEKSGRRHDGHHHGEVHAGPARSEAPCTQGHHPHGIRASTIRRRYCSRTGTWQRWPWLKKSPSRRASSRLQYQPWAGLSPFLAEVSELRPIRLLRRGCPSSCYGDPMEGDIDPFVIEVGDQMPDRGRHVAVPVIIRPSDTDLPDTEVRLRPQH